jgi:purine-binding chemotaxis protein CheW
VLWEAERFQGDNQSMATSSDNELATSSDNELHGGAPVLGDALGEMFQDLLGAESTVVEGQENEPTLTEAAESADLANPEDARTASQTTVAADTHEVDAHEVDEMFSELVSELPAGAGPEEDPEVNTMPGEMLSGVVRPESAAAEAPMEDPLKEVLEEGPGNGAAPAAETVLEAAPAAEPDEPQKEYSNGNGLEALISEIDRHAERHLQDRLYGEAAQPRRSPIQQDSCIVFLLDGTCYAIPIRSVLEIDAIPRVTTVPNMPDFVRGVTNVRGEIIAVLDLRVLLGLEPSESAGRGRILIVRTADQQTAALAVDEVRGTTGLALAGLAQPSSPIHDRVAPVLLGVSEHQDHVLNVLDMDKLFRTPELQRFTVN